MSDWTWEYVPDAANVVGGLTQDQVHQVESLASRIADAVAVRRIGTPFDVTEAVSNVKSYGEGPVSLTAEPVLAASPNDISFAKVAYPRTARIICNGTVYIKNERPTGAPAWKEADEITAESFYLEADAVSITR